MSTNTLPKKLMEDFENYCKQNKIEGSNKEKLLEKLKVAIIKYRYEPGEAIGIITAQSISEPATQMSIDSAEKVIIRHGKRVKVTKIGEFVDRILDIDSVKECDGWDVAETSGLGIYVPGMADNEKVVWKKLLAVSRHEAPKYLIKIKTVSGREIVATDSHSFMSRVNGQVVPVEGSALKVGGRLPCVRYLECIENKSLREEHGFMLGTYLAEGSSGIQIQKTLDVTVLDDARALLLKSNELPNFVYSAGEQFLRGLLCGYFVGQENSKNYKAPKEIIDGMAMVMTRFGIFACTDEKLSVPADYSNIFRERIGMQPVEKDFPDVIDCFGTVLKDAAKKIGHKSRQVNSFTKLQKINRSALIRHIFIFENMSKEKKIDINKELSIMKKMAYSDVFWDEIESISKIRPTSKYVYDFTVEGTETFTTFPGIITHNTMRSYILASQSDRLSKVTQGLPRLIEVFDARKTFEKNMMIYLKPEYNTKEKAKEIALKIKSQKLVDIITEDSLDLVNMRIELEFEKESWIENVVKELFKKHVKNAEVSYRMKRAFIKLKKEDIKNLRKIKNKLLKLHVGGVKDIENVFIMKEDDEWVIHTVGTNLKKILRMPWVDIKRTKTNDIHQIYEVLGIEAARNSILNESKDTMDEQGLEVDIRHLMLVADMMTFDGDVKDIGRYGVSGKKASVLARANFEETKKHIVNASFYGEVDNIEGVIENVIIGQTAPIGTGMVNLHVDPEKLRPKKR